MTFRDGSAWNLHFNTIAQSGYSEQLRCRGLLRRLDNRVPHSTCDDLQPVQRELSLRTFAQQWTAHPSIHQGTSKTRLPPSIAAVGLCRGGERADTSPLPAGHVEGRDRTHSRGENDQGAFASNA